MSTNTPTELSAVIACAAHDATGAHPLHRYLTWSLADLADEAARLPDRLRAQTNDPEQLVKLAERMLGAKIVGKTLKGRAARVLDAGYWRRALRRAVARERERLELQGGRVGKDGRAYCSAHAQQARAAQRQAQQQWIEEATLQAVVDGEPIDLPMAGVVKTPHQKLSRLYAFIAAMDRLADEGGLTVALVTATLESEWHPNPAHGKPGHAWNGRTPAEASKEVGARWQDIRRDLDKRGIATSGLWAAEPHRDGCPHRHFWLIYAPEHQREVFAAFLTHFPGKLKLRGGGKDTDRMIETAAEARAGVSRPLKRKREGAQIDVSLIDRDKGSGASYVIKYVSKAIGAEGAFDGADAPPRSAREQRNLQAIDAYRSLWGMRGAQFFGIQSCLSLWDELRRVQTTPVEPELAALWRAARGGDLQGRIQTEQQRGDAYEFLRLRGGLAATPQAENAAPAAPFIEEDEELPCWRLVGLAKSDTVTQYGEKAKRIEGVKLVEKRLVDERIDEDGVVETLPVPKEEETTLEALLTHEVRWTMKPPPPVKLARAAAREKAPADAAGDS